MLRDLFIKDFAIIKEMEITFTKGLNVLTGETGAGKSILIDAVGQLLGERANSEFIRTGCAKASVQGIFELPPNGEISSLLKEIGVEEEEDGTLLLSREVSLSGKNKCRLNGLPITLSIFRSIGKKLIDILGQHSHQSLLNEDKQLLLLDSFGGKTLTLLKKEVKELYDEISKKNKDLHELLGYERNGLREKDLFTFQLQEIDSHALEEHEEEEELMKERNRLDGSHELAAGCEQINALIYADNNSAYDHLSRSIEILQNMVKYDMNLEDSLEELRNAIYSVEEVSRIIRNYSEHIEFDPERLNYINNRLDIISNLKRKYGNSITEILKYREEIAVSLDRIENSSAKIQEIERELQVLNELYAERAVKLTSVRKEIALRLEKEIINNLQALAMPNVDFKVQFRKCEHKTPGGYDLICFMFSPNPGEELKPLSKIASGGEMSRVMLAIKATLAEVDDIPVMIFDEIDTGVAGESVQAVAHKLAELGKTAQVICVTHAASIAVRATSHFGITKQMAEERTITSVKKLLGEEKVGEITRMLGGSDAAKDHARSLLSRN